MIIGKEGHIPVPDLHGFPHESKDIDLNMAVWYADFPRDEAYGKSIYKMLKLFAFGVVQENGRPRSPEGVSLGPNMQIETTQMFHTSDLVHVILSERALHEYGNGKYLEGLTGLHDIDMQRGLDEHLVVLIRLEDTFAKMFQGISYLDLYPGANEDVFKFTLREIWSNALSQPRHR